MKKYKAATQQDGSILVSFEHNGEKYANTIQLSDNEQLNAKLLETTLNNISEVTEDKVEPTDEVVNAKTKLKKL